MYEIEVINTQNIDGETAVTKERAKCALKLKGGKTYIMYKTEYEGDEVSTAIIVSASKTVIRRSGYINSVMTYRVGEEFAFKYETPYGAVEMRTFTDKIDYDFTESGGMLRLLYTLNIQGEKYYNDMTITVREGL